MDRRYWIGILIVVALGAIIFALAQNQTLNQTQSTLVAAQNTVTAQSNQLNGQATSAVETLAAAGTQAANDQQKAVGDAQSAAATALSAAVSNQQHTAATAQAQAVGDVQSTASVLQQNAEDVAGTAQSIIAEEATALAAVQSTAAAQADALTSAQGDAATAQANAQTQALIAATAQVALQDAMATAQTASDAQAPLLATIGALQSQLDGASTQAASGAAATPSLPPDVAGAVTPAAGWERLVGRSVAIQLPESFDAVDLTSTNTTALSDMLRNLGPEFASAAAIIQQNPDLLVFMAFDNRSKSGLVSNVLILAQDLPFELPLKSLVDATIAQLPSSIHVTENDVVQVGSREAGRIVADNTLTTPSSKQVEYFFIESGRVYIVVFTTTADEFDTRLPVFVQAVESLEFIPGS